MSLYPSLSKSANSGLQLQSVYATPARGAMSLKMTTVLGDAVAQLQRVDIVVVAKSPATQVHATAMGEKPAHPLLAVQRGRHHVHLQDVGPAVVVEIGDID